MKKSQVKFGETFAIMIIVYMVLVSGFIWYNHINEKKLYELSQQDNRNKGFEKYNFIINLDLLHYSNQGVVDDNLDVNSIYAFEAYAQTDEGKKYIADRIGQANITIRLYNYTELTELNKPDSQLTYLNRPSFKERERIQLYLNVPPKENIKNKETFSIVVPVVNETGNNVGIGILRIEVPSES